MVQAWHVYRGAVDALRTAAEPLTAREIAERVLVAANVTDSDRAAPSDLTGSVLASLRNQKGKGVERTMKVVRRGGSYCSSLDANCAPGGETSSVALRSSGFSKFALRSSSQECWLRRFRRAKKWRPKTQFGFGTFFGLCSLYCGYFYRSIELD